MGACVCIAYPKIKPLFKKKPKINTPPPPPSDIPYVVGPKKTAILEINEISQRRWQILLNETGGDAWNPAA